MQNRDSAVSVLFGGHLHASSFLGSSHTSQPAKLDIATACSCHGAALCLLRGSSSLQKRLRDAEACTQHQNIERMASAKGLISCYSIAHCGKA